uniref:Putative secreted protein n=1 Tax=Anopheles marajoara TaxID=58244 RepID=A0A2M4C873_9DIPT
MRLLLFLFASFLSSFRGSGVIAAHFRPRPPTKTTATTTRPPLADDLPGNVPFFARSLARCTHPAKSTERELISVAADRRRSEPPPSRGTQDAPRRTLVAAGPRDALP